jgi:hypothetical protein
MQTSKFLFAAGAIAAMILPLQLQAAPDTEAQAKMREALRQKMQELNTPVPPLAPAPPPAPAVPPPVAPAPVATPAPAPKAGADAATQAIRQQNQTASPATTATPPPVAAPAVVVPPAQTEVVAAPPATTGSKFSSPPETHADEASLARAREAMRQKLQETPATPTSATTASVVVKQPEAPKQSGTTTPPGTVVLAPPAATPIQAPDSPLSGSKQERLAELLARYKADAITAQEYHSQRAAILAEP